MTPPKRRFYEPIKWLTGANCRAESITQQKDTKVFLCSKIPLQREQSLLSGNRDEKPRMASRCGKDISTIKANLFQQN